jgi:hypothetical protein
LNVGLDSSLSRLVSVNRSPAEFRHSDVASAAGGTQVQAGFVELLVLFEVVADSAIVAFERRGDDRATAMKAVFDELDRGGGGISTAGSAPAHGGPASTAGREYRGVVQAHRDHAPAGSGTMADHYLVVDPRLAARRTPERRFEQGLLNRREPAKLVPTFSQLLHGVSFLNRIPNRLQT